METLSPEKLESLYRRHKRGALVRSMYSVAMWGFNFIAFLMKIFTPVQFMGVTASILLLLLINPPTLFILKKIRTVNNFERFSILINELEIIGYTMIIYFCGGIEITHLVLLYAALISYVAVVAPRRHCYIVATLCVLNYGAMISAAAVGILPQIKLLPDFSYPLPIQLLSLSIFIALLYVIAFISATSAGLIRKQREGLRHQNLEMAETNQRLLKEIEERKITDASLRRSEEKYRNIIESIAEGYFEIDLQGRIHFFNETLIKILGFGNNELTGMRHQDLITVETLDHVDGAFQRILKGQKAAKAVDYEIITKNGEKRALEMSASLISDSSGAPAGFRCVVRDITERKQAEEAKKELAVRLQRAKKMEAIGTLAGGVAHDLNNILSGIVTYPDLLLMQLPADSPLRKPVETIKTTGKKAATIVQDLLTLARSGVTIKEVFNLNAIIQDYLNSPEFERLNSFHPDMQIQVKLDPELMNTNGSPVHIFKVVMNLVTNAAEAMLEGGSVTIETQNIYVDSPIQGYDKVEKGDYVSIKVSDTGVGVSFEDRDKIFEPFYTKKIMGRTGTGLGMAVVWGTVKDHKGYIDLKSTLNKGSTFTIYLPATLEKATSLPSGTASRRLKGAGESILVVDDSPEQREITTAMLKELGYAVTTVGSGEAAVDMVKENVFDLLILDMVMEAGMDGLDTYREIIRIHPGQKTIIVSGFSETDRMREAQRLGAGEYVKKPYSVEQISAAIRKALEEKAAEQATKR